MTGHDESESESESTKQTGEKIVKHGPGATATNVFRRLCFPFMISRAAVFPAIAISKLIFAQRDANRML